MEGLVGAVNGKARSWSWGRGCLPQAERQWAHRESQPKPQSHESLAGHTKRSQNAPYRRRGLFRPCGGSNDGCVGRTCVLQVKERGGCLGLPVDRDGIIVLVPFPWVLLLAFLSTMCFVCFFQRDA